MNLGFLMHEAYDAGVIGHPQEVMKRLGITYKLATPQSMGDQWWFWKCENAPSPLPEYLEPLNLEPWECVGFGLSEEEALELSGIPKEAQELAGSGWEAKTPAMILEDIQGILEAIRNEPLHAPTYFYPIGIFRFRKSYTRKKRQEHLVKLMRWFDVDLRTAKALSLGKVDTGSALMSLKEIRELVAGGKAK